MTRSRMFTRARTLMITAAVITTAIVTMAATLLAQSPTQTPQTQPKDFDSPEQAATALIDAASKNDTQALKAILGTTARGILTSGDTAQDESERQDFARLASARHHTERSSMNDNSAVLLIGQEDWPFPVPLVRTGGKWHFDPQKGQIEMEARRIGANELDAVDICQGYVTAQQEYAARKAAHDGQAIYAQSIENGLYQPQGADRLVPAGFAAADASVPAPERKPYHGYYFRVLRKQGPDAPGGAHDYVVRGAMIGGFALLAWPAQYGVTGVHTFIVGGDGDVYEKDLGTKTAVVAPAITSYDPDSSWNLVD